jgi:hypothetical protein
MGGIQGSKKGARDENTEEIRFGVFCYYGLIDTNICVGKRYVSRKMFVKIIMNGLF